MWVRPRYDLFAWTPFRTAKYLLESIGRLHHQNGGTLFANFTGSLVEIASGAVVNGGLALIGKGIADIAGSSGEALLRAYWRGRTRSRLSREPTSVADTISPWQSRTRANDPCCALSPNFPFRLAIFYFCQQYTV
jgi:hypothetical protein